MENSFEKYKQAKLVLYHMIGQMYNYNITEKEASKLGIPYREDENTFNRIEVCYHYFDPLGERAWQLLELDNSMITYDELWDLEKNVKREKFDKNKNYAYKALKIELLLLYMILDYYSHEISKEEADNRNIKYDDVFDLDNDKVKVCDHYCETAGEQAWNLFNIENNYVANSYLEDMKNDIKNKLLKIENN